VRDSLTDLVRTSSEENRKTTDLVRTSSEEIQQYCRRNLEMRRRFEDWVALFHEAGDVKTERYRFYS